jgi:glycogen debranching enzyme
MMVIKGGFVVGYRIGEQMKWWPKDSERYKEWHSETNSKVAVVNNSSCEECCYSECQNCHSELFVVFEFKDCIPLRVLKIGREYEWPADFFK